MMTFEEWWESECGLDGPTVDNHRPFSLKEWFKDAYEAGKTYECKEHQKYSLEDDLDVGYMCKTDFEYELYNALGGVTIYASVDDAIERRKCVLGCGLVKVKVRYLETVIEESDNDIGDYLDL